jgi:hypothetical protein
MKDCCSHQASTCQKVPADFQEKLLTFQRYAIQLRKKQNYPFRHGGNADEMVVPQNYTFDVGSAKEVKIRRAGYEKQLVMEKLCTVNDHHKFTQNDTEEWDVP